MLKNIRLIALFFIAANTFGLSGMSVAQTTLDAQLRQAACTQNWRQAIRIVEQMKRESGSDASKLGSEQKQLESLARGKFKLPSWNAAETQAKLCPLSLLKVSPEETLAKP